MQNVANKAQICFNSSMVRLGVAKELPFFKFFPVSIPVWFDWESPFRDIYITITQVSIPVWFDWEFDFNTVSDLSLRGFNSSMVRLGDE